MSGWGLLLWVLAAAPGPTRWSALTAQERQAALAEAEPLPLAQKILRHSARFLGTPYQVSPLGEGQGQDPDPLLRYDAVDCLTFVEQSLALALSPNEAGVLPVLERLRYAEHPEYASRNHLMEAQWLPNNLRKGFLEDITRAVAGADAVADKKVISEKSWQSKSSRELRLPASAQPRGEFPLQLIPLAKLGTYAGQIPEGTVLVVVREDLAHKSTRITHLGFVHHRGGRTYLRHAARNHYGKVIDEDLETFLTRNSKYTKWKVSGVSLFQPQAPPAPP